MFIYFLSVLINLQFVWPNTEKVASGEPDHQLVRSDHLLLPHADAAGLARHFKLWLRLLNVVFEQTYAGELRSIIFYKKKNI